LGKGRARSDDGSELERRASYLADRGDYAAALKVQRLLVEERERSLGAQHPATLTARASLAHWMRRAGDAAGARDQFAALLPVRPHPGTERLSRRCPALEQSIACRWLGGKHAQLADNRGEVEPHPPDDDGQPQPSNWGTWVSSCRLVLPNHLCSRAAAVPSKYIWLTALFTASQAAKSPFLMPMPYRS